MKLFNKSSTGEEVTEGLDLSGRTILVTGCNSGLGLETMRVLALRGARVLGTARTEAKASKACASIKGDTIPLVCELSEPSSVRSTVEAVEEPLDAIIANAGIMALQDRNVQYGVEEHMLTNHVGHFILVTGLQNRLTTDGRVVILSSGAHSYARGKELNFDDLAWDHRTYTPWIAYGYSKLANILFAKELARRLPQGQTANALHPGIIDTAIWRNVPDEAAKRMKRSLSFKTIEQGAATGIFIATHPSPSNISGEYFTNCAIGKPSAFAQDENLAARLWEVTEELVDKI